MDTRTNKPKISVAIPIHDMKNGDLFLSRLLNSLQAQTFRDFEIVITKQGKMAENTNAAIRRSKGEIIKILYMDDYLQPDALQHIADTFTYGWLATGCTHDDGISSDLNPHFASYHGIPEGANTIGSPSVIAIENKNPLLFDENMSWLLDVDYYKRLYNRYGEPKIINEYDVVMGIGEHQMTHILTAEQKIAEHNYLLQKNAQ